MSFPRLRSLTQDPNTVLTSLAKSPNDVIQASKISYDSYNTKERENVIFHSVITTKVASKNQFIFHISSESDVF